MLFRIVLMVRVLVSLAIAASQDLNFPFSGFRSTSLSLDGLAELTSNGLLRLTNETYNQMGHAFYPNPVTFKNSINSTAFTFSTTFVFAIIPEYAHFGGHGIAFVIAPTRGLPGALPNQNLGLFSNTNNGNQTNHVVAVELDTIYSTGFNDIDDNHVGIDINGLESERSASAGYYSQLNGEILEARDPNLGTEYIAEEMELVLKLGLMCSHSEPAARPSMRQVVQFLEGNVPLPDISPLRLSASGLTFSHREGFDESANSYPSSMDMAFAHSSSVAESLLSGGR
ncbi:PREDICTED: L-type lectin-domain containing receptor kinase IV.1-like [Populus euphratica]|uniref:L-type lectin-domain containing receptor kinase IV.1-like n=1 Tax=Populus euphratica TaxID=75702 RepID=A0AAJ6T8X4_POPEU|nr:PREDICTED: L-type lectin-domain containing receptor kinase IV.1-like [Populus euphratica]